MKLDSSKYKLALYTESVCADCTTLKNKLKELNIPFHNKCITIDREKGDFKNNPNVDNRWEFHDAAEAHPDKFKYTPVMILEDIEGNTEYYSAGNSFETPDEAITLLEKYCR